MSSLGHASCVGLVLLIGNVGFAQDPRHSEALQRQQRPPLETQSLTSTQLITYLGSDYFAERHAAHFALHQRGTTVSQELLKATQNEVLERRVRIERLLEHQAEALRESVLPAPEITATVSNSRFWEGSNQYLGGIPDQSLDSDVSLQGSSKLLEVLTPFPVVRGKTDRGEVLRAQVWARNLGCPTSASLYLTCPVRPFTHVDVVIDVTGTTEHVDEFEVALKPGTTELRKDVCWLVVTEQGKGRSPATYQLELTDRLGRIYNEGVVQFLDSDGERVKIKPTGYDSRFRQTWSLTVAAETALVFQAKLSTGVLPFRKQVSLRLLHPDIK